MINSVKITFFYFPHKLSKFIDFNGIIKIPPLLDLAAMKAYALGGRANWKDVDYSEPIEFIGEEITGEEIKEFLIDAATIPF